MSLLKLCIESLLIKGKPEIILHKNEKFEQGKKLWIVKKNESHKLMFDVQKNNGNINKFNKNPKT